MGPGVYLDYNATAPVRPAVAAAVAEALARTGNASSVHRFGRLAHRALEEAREKVAALIGARPDQVVFTSGGTEANNLALGAAGTRRIIVCAIEHDSILNAVPEAERAPVGRDGVVDLARLERLLAGGDRQALVCLMLANNETGAIQPVAAAAALARRHGALLHCDAVQGAGKIPVDMPALEADLLSLSAHKLGGPQGTGALVLADRVSLQPGLRGGGQERGRRAGTENLPGIVGFGVAAELAAGDLPRMQEIAGLRDALERRLRALLPSLQVFAADASRLPNTSCLAGLPMSSETQVMALDLAGVAVSAGAACSSGKVRPSGVLQAMGFGAEEAGRAIRVSLGWQSSAADVDRFVEAWGALLGCRAAQPGARLPAA